MATGEYLRLSVTGHRNLASVEEIEAAVDVVLDRRLAAGGTARSPEIWSGLAEGADRLVTQRVLARPGGRLNAVLPLDADDYERDFATEASRHEFRELLAGAHDVQVTGPDESGSRESAYERAGRAAVDASEALIALWDGEPSRGQGGTAEIIDYARRHDVDLEIVLVERDAAGG